MSGNYKLLINDKDLQTILNIDGDTILDMIGNGLPHYFCNGYYYFNYDEVKNWIIESSELGYMDTWANNCKNFIDTQIKTDTTMSNIQEYLDKYLKKNSLGMPVKDLEKLYWLNDNLGGKKFFLFSKYMETCFPYVPYRIITKFYVAMLDAISSVAVERDILNDKSN